MNIHLLSVICISTLLFILPACEDPICLEAEKIITNNEIVIEQKEKVFLENAQKHFAKKRAEAFKHSPDEIAYYSLKSKDINELSFSKLPYYQLDTSFISQNPDIDILLDHIHLIKDTPLYIGKLHQEYAIIMNLRPCKENCWEPEFTLEGIEYFQNLFNWLSKALNEAGTQKFYVLESMGIHYIMYYAKPDEPRFCNFPGNIQMDKSSFLQHILDRYNNNNKAKSLSLSHKKEE